jgi:hypothetical protein
VSNGRKLRPRAVPTGLGSICYASTRHFRAGLSHAAPCGAGVSVVVLGSWELLTMGKNRKVKPVASRKRPTGRNNSKHVGEIAEMEFMLEAARRRFGVSRPFANNQRYDVILDAPRRLWRVQVKGSGARHHAGFSVRACWRTTRKHMPYTSKQIDFLAVVVEDKQGRRIWYLIPVRALGGRLTIHVYPFGCRKDGEKRYEKYREAWGLLGKPEGKA